MHLLCRIGLHKNRDLWRGHWDGLTQKVHMKCLRCGHEEVVTLVSPLSGPRRGPKHPDEGRRLAIEYHRGASY